jgi:hypothetical protein
MLDIPIKLPHHIHQPCEYGWITAAAAFALTYAHHSFTCEIWLSAAKKELI